MLHACAVFSSNSSDGLREDLSGQLRALNTEQAQVRLHGDRPGTERELARDGKEVVTPHNDTQGNPPALSQ